MVLHSLPASTVTHTEMISKPSKSARKRQQLALQSLGERLIGLTTEQLYRIHLEERLFDAIMAAKSIAAHGALRRQKQLIGKLMRDVDPEPIEAAIDTFGHDDRQEKRIFREAESWRDRITGDDPDALEELFAHIGHENKTLSNEVKAWRAAVADKFRKQARRRIFREIHKEIAMKVQNDARNI